MRLRGDDDTPGRVIAVVLLAAVAIVGASIVATVALEMGQDADGDVVAGASANFDRGAGEVRVVFTSMERPATSLEATVYNTSNGSAAATVTLTRVGESRTFSLADGGQFRVVVVAQWRDARSVVLVKVGRL